MLLALWWNSILVVNLHIRILSDNNRSRRHKRVKDHSLFANPSAAQYVWKSFKMWASKVSLIKSLRSRSSIICSTTLYETDWKYFCLLRNVSRKTSFIASSAIGVILFATNYFTAVFTSRAMMSSFFSWMFSVLRLYWSILSSLLAGAALSPDHNWPFSFVYTSHVCSDMWSVASVLANANNGSSKSRNVAFRLASDWSTSRIQRVQQVIIVSIVSDSSISVFGR